MKSQRSFIDYSLDKRATQYSGRIKTPRELVEMEREFGEFTVYIVEVCRNCSWNHLCASYILGDGIQRKAPRKVRTLEDEDYAKG